MIILKKLNHQKDISKNYFEWMNNKKIIRYTEQKYKKNSISDIKKYVKKINNSNNEFLFGIFLKKNLHIGNIKLGPVNKIHKTAEISYFIGETKYWGKGYATMAIKKIIEIAKKKKIKKLKAGFYAMNKQSEKVLKKNGFKLEGFFKSEVLYRNKRYNSYKYGKIIK